MACFTRSRGCSRVTVVPNRPRPARLRAAVAALLVGALVAGCTGGTATDGADRADDAGSDAPAVETSRDGPVAPAELRIEVDGALTAVGWEPHPSVDHYVFVLRGNDLRRLAPAGCAELCVIVVDRSSLVLGPVSAQVRAVDADGRQTLSPAVELEAPPPTPRDDRYQPGVEVLREVDGEPHTEFIPTDTQEEAEELADRLRRDLADDPEVIAVIVGGPIDELGQGVHVWTSDALELPAFAEQTSASGVRIGVIELDDVDRSHPDLAHLAPAISVGPEGRLEDVDPTSGDHATAVVGALVGGSGMPGIAADADIQVYEIGSGMPSAAALEQAIRIAVEDGVDVLNISLSTVHEQHPHLEQALDEAVARGVLVVVGAGNHAAEGCPTREGREHGRPTLPAGSPSVVAVGAVGADGTVWGCSVDAGPRTVFAPGHDVPLLEVGRRPWFFGLIGPVRWELQVATGTSYASPWVAGLAAALLALDPELSPLELRAVIEATLDARGSIDTLLAAALADPGAPGYTISVQHRATRRQRGLYFSTTAISAGDRLVGAGQLWMIVARPPERTMVCSRDRAPSRWALREAITVAGARVDGDTWTLEFDPAGAVTERDPSCRDASWADGWFEDHERAAAAIGSTPVEVRLGRSGRTDEVEVSLYEGRCAPLSVHQVGGCRAG
jgi:subtilisin family serine protease